MVEKRRTAEEDSIPRGSKALQTVGGVEDFCFIPVNVAFSVL